MLLLLAVVLRIQPCELPSGWACETFVVVVVPCHQLQLLLQVVARLVRRLLLRVLFYSPLAVVEVELLSPPWVLIFQLLRLQSDP